jgi:FMN phosphatase YigB (HAD superfamily)
MWPQLSADDKDLTAPLTPQHPNNPSQSFVFFDAGMVIVDLNWDLFLDGIAAFYASGGFDRTKFRTMMHQTRLLSDWECGRIGPSIFVERFCQLLQDSQKSNGDLLRLPHLLDIKSISSSIIGLMRAPVFELVSKLRAKGYATGILSNASPWHECDLYQQANLTEHFDVILFSQDLGLAKPDPAIYRTAEQLASRYLEQRSVSHTDSSSTDSKKTNSRPAAPTMYFVDDTPANIRAARAAGWQASLVDHVRDPEHWISKDLGTLSQIKTNLVFGSTAAQRVADLFQLLI